MTLSKDLLDMYFRLYGRDIDDTILAATESAMDAGELTLDLHGTAAPLIGGIVHSLHGYVTLLSVLKDAMQQP